MKILQCSEISKEYRAYGREWKRILSWFGFPFAPREQKKVLNHISFTIRPGESVGIIGQNGAGKSTLLKIISGTTLPTSGSFLARGDIAAILELGMGFNPELTGRQNSIHSLGLMGFSREKIKQLVPLVEGFAEIGDSFDQPVRTYSSGMQIRVAFAVATAERPDLLIVDEALSVGDTYFQHKSFKRIREFQSMGTSLLLVSHDHNAIMSICNRAILMDRGEILLDGSPQEVSDYYNALIADREAKMITRTVQADGQIATGSGTGEARVKKIELTDERGEPVESVEVGEKVNLNISVEILKDLDRLILGYMIKNRYSADIYGTNTHHLNQPLENVKCGDIYNFQFSFTASLGVGHYSISTALTRSDTHLEANYEWKDVALIFSVENKHGSVFSGLNWLPPRFQIQKEDH